VVVVGGTGGGRGVGRLVAEGAGKLWSKKPINKRHGDPAAGLRVTLERSSVDFKGKRALGKEGTRVVEEASLAAPTPSTVFASSGNIHEAEPPLLLATEVWVMRTRH
jgi:hypothetical protein